MKITRNKYKLKQEKILTQLIYREFKRWERKLAELLQNQNKFYDKKTFEEELEKLIEYINTQIVLIITKKAKQVIWAWFNAWKKQFKKLTEWFAIQWNLRNDEAVRYLQKLEDLHLSNKDGSIWKTTKSHIIHLLQKWTNDWLSYAEIWEQISKLDPFVFSQARWELIAVTEIGRAYEFWNYLPMKKLQDKWEIVKKRWSTVWDDRVRPSHKQNQADGWIDLKLPFSWTQSMIAPCCFRCRCATQYNIL